MINAGIFLVPAVHEIAAAAEFAITTRAAKKPDPHPLTDSPALDAGTKGIDAPDHFMAWDTRPVDREQAFHRAGIRVANPTRLYANPYLIGARVQKWFTYFREFSRSRDFYRFVGCVHIHPLGSELFQVMVDVDLPPFATSACDSNRTHSQNTRVRGLWAKHAVTGEVNCWGPVGGISF
jgi:hypothetical protein